jgi:hypothetical protein
MQELNTLIWMLMLAYLWHQWFVLYKQRSTELAHEAASPPDMKSITRLSDTFLHWQLSSVALASGFIVFTGIFWGLVIVNKDKRYLVPAVVVHVLWALSWMLATLPLFATWQDFNRKKTRALLASSRGEMEGERVSAETEALEKLSPVTLWNGFGSVVTAVLSFAFPIVHALLK